MSEFIDNLVSVNIVIWLFPIAFIIHDLEEIITAGSFMRENRERVIMLLPYRAKKLFERIFSISSFQFGIAVGFISIFVMLATYLGSQFMGNDRNITFFTSAIIIFFVHVFTHVGQAVLMRTYAPGVVTAVAIVLPYSLYAFHRLFRENIINWSTIYTSLPYCLLIIPIVLFAHALGRRVASHTSSL